QRTEFFQPRLASLPLLIWKWFGWIFISPNYNTLRHRCQNPLASDVFAFCAINWDNLLTNIYPLDLTAIVVEALLFDT
ncbi:MAG: hypothetical protein B6243_07085, partial [Anaerolineaceae bacterium 4572_5.2]